jgi:hypothetical protein
MRRFVYWRGRWRSTRGFRARAWFVRQIREDLEDSLHLRRARTIIRHSTIAVGPVIHEVEVVGGWLSLPEAEDVDERQSERNDGHAEGLPEASCRKSAARGLSLERAEIHGRTAETEGRKERLHDDRCAGDDKTTDDRKFSGVGVPAPDGKPATDNANGAEDEADEHDDPHRFAGPFGKPTGGLREDGHRAQREEK